MNLTQEDAQDFQRICKKIGLESMRHVKLFEQEQKRENETLIDALRRYEKAFDAIEINEEGENQEWWKK
nr:MAG TPA: hypothetical protein [Caudoviricetes sp.]